MDIKNLSQFKKAMQNGHDFVVEKHYCHPEYIGQVRTVKECGTSFMYTGIKDEPLHKVSQLNNGKGCYLNFRKASDWKFENGLCTMINRKNEPLFTFRVI